jgi:Flp pilus assembly protein TadG
MRRITRRLRDESGMTYVFVGLGFMAFLGASMLAIDVGMLMTARNQAQNSADAAALAGATALAFDNWDDRSATGPAVTNAITTGQANRVMAGVVSVTPPDITFPVNPTNGQNNRVQATVWRSRARGNPVPTLIARYFGIATATIGATATAEASPANAMTCVKPFTIPDKWQENQCATEICPFDPSDTFERYDKKGNVIPNPDVYVPAFDSSGHVNAGYTGYNNQANRGMRMVLRAGQGNQITSSFYYSLSMTDSMGGNDYRWNIANCNHTIYHWGDQLIQEPGDMQGPTIQGIQDLINRDPGAYWDNGCNCVKNSAFGDRQSPRVFPIPLYDPDYYAFGKQMGRVASLKTANWIGYFVEYIGNGSEIHGRIIPIGGIRDKTWNGPGAPGFPLVIRLVQ